MKKAFITATLLFTFALSACSAKAPQTPEADPIPQLKAELTDAFLKNLSSETTGMTASYIGELKSEAIAYNTRSEDKTPGTGKKVQGPISTFTSYSMDEDGFITYEMFVDTHTELEIDFLLKEVNEKDVRTTFIPSSKDLTFVPGDEDAPRTFETPELFFLTAGCPVWLDENTPDSAFTSIEKRSEGPYTVYDVVFSEEYYCYENYGYPKDKVPPSDRPYTEKTSLSAVFYVNQNTGRVDQIQAVSHGQMVTPEETVPSRVNLYTVTFSYPTP